jgi:peptidoglycan/xylan/chitin deacetylase (PgdA/CDA1 family)
MRPSRKISCIFVLALAAISGCAAIAMAGTRREDRRGDPAPDLERAGLSQEGRELIATVRTARPLPLGLLDPLPRRAGSGGTAFLCFELSRSGSAGARRLCLGGADRPHRRAGLELVNAAGKVTEGSTIPARVKRPSPDKLVLAVVPGDAGLRPHHYEWRVLESRGACAQPARRAGSVRSAPRCVEALPPGGRNRAFRLRPVRAVGCTGAAPVLDTNGPRDRMVLALTFDDGPSEYTPGFLKVLREKHVHATFFEIGQEVAGREQTMRRILREGDEIGNHTMHHATLPGYPEISEASAAIEGATRFKPCLFRPPGGASDAAVIETAAQLGMRTITWDVDPADWTDPGSAAVFERVVGAARPGSIILMHDGGGNRSGTLAALPQIIDTLRARGYRFATVSELLGYRLLYRPYG